MKTYHRWAALAGAAVLAFSSVTTAWADEGNQGGATMETATLVPEFQGAQNNPDGSESVTAPAVTENGGSGGQTADNGGSENTGNQAADHAGPGNTGSQNAGGSTTIIRVNPDASDSQGGNSGSQNGGQNASGGTDYSAGPGAFNQQAGQQDAGGQTADSGSSGAAAVIDAQIADVTNDPIVVTTEKYSYDQMVNDMNRLKQRYGNRIRVNGIGTSLDGRTIFDCIVGNPSASKHILVQGGIHGREYLNPMLIMQQMEMALANYDSGSIKGQSLSGLFQQVAIHFVPMSNPDGVSISQFGFEGIRSQELKDIISTSYVMDTAAGRTTADLGTYLSKWKANGRGVDLNLNFDALWNDVYTAEFPSYSGYKGTAPGSEPEAQALMNLYNNPSYPWKAVVNYHSMGDVIYWDILGNKVQPESSELANLMSAVTGGYRILPSEGGGGFKDWIQLGGRPVPSVTLETGKVACPIPLSEYGTIWSQNRITWAVAMEWAAAR
ncbi:MAG: M14 family zinc carboxypeptidase [Lachnospiraceae bacterium]|nr:M14 family zinc carboxypeptidase [Lachnospiraceae bacterium]